MYEGKPYYYGTGRRKNSVARVRVYPGTGKITINDRDIDDYFGLDTLKLIVRQPMAITDTLGKFDIICRVSGGGAGAFVILRVGYVAQDLRNAFFMNAARAERVNDPENMLLRERVRRDGIEGSDEIVGVLIRRFAAVRQHESSHMSVRMRHEHVIEQLRLFFGYREPAAGVFRLAAEKHLQREARHAA